MQYLLFGLAALIIFLFIARAYTMANPQVLVRQLRIGAGVAVLAGAGVLVFRGAIGYAMSLAALGSWLLWGAGSGPWGGSGNAPKSAGQTSRVTTDHLEVELDHDTGEISGRVLKGYFAGRELEGLAPAEMAHLWQDCRFADPQSAQILEAYLDRAHPDLARGHGARRRRGDGSGRQDDARAGARHPGARGRRQRRRHPPRPPRSDDEAAP